MDMIEPVTLPAGKYLIGDLCYRDDDMWDMMLNTPDGKKGVVENRYEGTTHTFVILPTQHGDGAYMDQFGKDYYVDSGTIGIMSWSSSPMDTHSGRTFDFDGPFQVYKDGSKLVFGSIIVETDPEIDDHYDVFGDHGPTEYDEWRDYDPEC
jgi:hypothetical protein